MYFLKFWFSILTFIEALFLYLYKVCSKSIKTEVVFTKTKMNNEWNIYLLLNSTFGIHHAHIALGFLSIKKLMFLCGVKIHNDISLNGLHILKSWDKFSV